MTVSSLVTCALEEWSPGIGDPSAMGWITVAVYVFAAWASGRRALSGPFPPATAGRERWFWSWASILLLLLAVNKQLDLQSFLTATGRCAAKAQGWYGDRKIVQWWFVLGVVTVGVACVAALALVLRATFRRTALAIVGLGFVIIFVVVRAAGFHHVDMLIGTWVAGMKVNWLLELPGPTLVLIAALRGTSPG